jgi:hypothetical protein
VRTQPAKAFQERTRPGGQLIADINRRAGSRVKDIADKLLAAFIAYLRGTGSPVAAAFLAQFDAEMGRRDTMASALPVLEHFDRIAAIAPPAERPLMRLLADGRQGLLWGQTYSAADFGAAFLDNYGWTELFGTRGPFVCDSMAGGFLVLGPETIYPDHFHVAEEVYVPLTPGTLWRKGAEDFVARAAGEVIHHPSQMPHAMRTRREPLLALYLWRGGDLAQKSAIVEDFNAEAAPNG